MKNWGDIIVVKDGEWHAFDWSWANRRILDMLIGGLELAQRHINTFRRSDDRDFFGLIPPDGSGALIDLDRKRLLFFGDELTEDVPNRRALVALIAEVWQGFAVVWAYGGTRELAAYVGLDCAARDLESRPTAIPTSDRYSPCHLVSVVGNDGDVRFWPLVKYYRPQEYGPTFLAALPGRGRKKVALKTIPANGVHVDLSRRSVGVWQTVDRSGRLGRFADTWSGWTVEFWDDRYEEQVARCGDGLRVPPLNLSAAVDNVRQELGGRIFSCSRWDGPTSDALALAETLSRIAPGFAAPEDAVIAGMVRPTQQEWARFAAACDGFELKQPHEIT